MVYIAGESELGTVWDSVVAHQCVPGYTTLLKFSTIIINHSGEVIQQQVDLIEHFLLYCEPKLLF